MGNKGEDINITIVYLTLGFLLFVLFIIFFITVYRLRLNRHLKDKIQMKANFKQTLLQSQIEIQEQTLQHISRELHDNFGHIASLIKINLFTLQLADGNKALEKIEETKDLTRQLIADIKSLSVSLSSDRILQTGLANAIKAEVERLNKTGEFTATFDFSGVMPFIDNDKLVILYRMAQEVLNNMIKHSQAKHITVKFSLTENLFTLVFNDDGIGFNVEERQNGSGAGLQNLTDRALLINAQLHIQSLPGNGTTITIEMPL